MQWGRLRDRSWLTAATLPVGWVRVAAKPKAGRMTSELCTSPTQPAMRVQNWHTQRAQCPAAVSFFSHPETVPSPPCQALCSWIPVNSVGRWSILETFGCYETWRWVTETDKYFSWGNSRGHGSGRTVSPPTMSIILYCIKLIQYVCSWSAQMCECNTRYQKYILLHKYKHISCISNKSVTTKTPFLSGGYDFSNCNPKCIVCKSALPIGTALLKRVSCNNTWIQKGLE